MKSVAVAAGFLGGLAAAHAGHGHQHAHNKRGADGVFTSWDITTEWDYVTVTAGQDHPQPSASASHQHVQAPVSVGHEHAQAPASVSQAPPSSSDHVQVAAVTTPAATSSTLDPNAVQMSINSAKAASNSAWQASMIALQSAKNNPSSVAPVQSQPTQAPAQTTSVIASSSSAAPVPSNTGASTGGTSSGGYKAIGTYYGTAGGYGSCGMQLTDDGHYVALADDVMQKTSKKLCGAAITITSNGQSYQATVQDSCPGCDNTGTGHIDIAQGFAHVIDPNIDVAGHADLTWSFNDASMASIMAGAI